MWLFHKGQAQTSSFNGLDDCAVYLECNVGSHSSGARKLGNSRDSLQSFSVSYYCGGGGGVFLVIVVVVVVVVEFNDMCPSPRRRFLATTGYVAPSPRPWLTELETMILFAKSDFCCWHVFDHAVASVVASGWPLIWSSQLMLQPLSIQINRNCQEREQISVDPPVWSTDSRLSSGGRCYFVLTLCAHICCVAGQVLIKGHLKDPEWKAPEMWSHDYLRNKAVSVCVSF